MTEEPREETEITTEEIKDALVEIPEKAWNDAKWPVISVVSRQTFMSYAGEEGFDPTKETRRQQNFWKEALLPTHLLTSENASTLIPDPNEVFLFVIHSFPEKNGSDTIFRAITTNPKEFVNDPSNSINYSHHGQPCENRGGGSYPITNFWAFYDHLAVQDQDRYPLPDTNWRKNFVEKAILNKR